MVLALTDPVINTNFKQNTMHQENQQLIHVINTCITECNHCATACLKEDDVKMLTRCIQLDLDCAAICNLAVNLISRDSEHAGLVIEECISICNACADECEKHRKMEHCKRCADICRKCADACRNYGGRMAQRA